MNTSVHQKKNKINMAYFKKAIGYVGSGTIEYFSDNAPTISSTVAEAKFTFDSARSGLSNVGPGVSSYIKQLKEGIGFKNISSWFLNKENEFDEEDNFDGMSFDDGTVISSSEISQSNFGSNDINASKISRSMIESSHKIVESQIASTANINISIDKQTAVISAGFDSTNKLLGNILEVLTKNTAALVETGNTTAKLLINNNKEEDHNANLMSSGKFNLSEYKDMVKNNLQNSQTGFALSAMMAFMDPSLMKEFLTPKQLTKSLVSLGLDKAAPKLKETTKALDDAVNDVIMSSLIRLGEGNNSKFNNSILKAFGIDSTRKKADTSRSSLELNATPFDTISKEAITNAIPGYLRKILVAVGGDDEIYDYRTRSFRSVKSIKKEFSNTATSTNTINQSTNRVRSKFNTNNEFTNLAFDLMMENLSSLTGNNGNDMWNMGNHTLRGTLSDFSNPEKTYKYLEGLFPGNISGDRKKQLKDFAKSLSSLDGYGISDLKLQAAKQSVNRNKRVEEFLSNMDAYQMDTSMLKDKKNLERNQILKHYGEKQSSVSLSNKNGNVYSGTNYTNLALYEIYRRLNSGINVYQTGQSNRRSTPYQNWKDKYLKKPDGYRPKTISENAQTNRSSIHGLHPIDDYENPLRNNQNQDGTREDLTTGQRVSRWGKTRGGEFMRAMASGNPDEVRAVMYDAFSDVSQVAGDGIKKGMSKVNSAYGNASGFIKNKLFGADYSYIDENGKTVHVKNTEGKNGEKGGLLGFLKDEIKTSLNKAKDASKNWWKDIQNDFDYGDEEDKGIASKRKKLIGGTIGAFAGAGILGGPIGLLVGSIAGSALSTSSLGKKLKDKLFGVDKKTGKSTGLLTKLFDKVTRPIEYQVKKTINFFAQGLKKHILGPISDIGFAIKNRVKKHVDTAFHKYFLDPLKKHAKSIGKKILSGLFNTAGKLWEGLVGTKAATKRAKAGAGMQVFDWTARGIARNIIGDNPEGLEELDRRNKARGDSALKSSWKFGSYGNFNEAKDAQRADRLQRLQEYMKVSTEKTSKNTEEIKNVVTKDLKKLADKGLEEGSIYVHDSHVHKYLQKIMEKLGIESRSKDQHKYASYDDFVNGRDNVIPFAQRADERSSVHIPGYGNVSRKAAGDGSVEDTFKGAALTSITTLATSGDRIDNRESNIMQSVITKASKKNVNNSEIAKDINRMITAQRYNMNKDADKKESFWSKLLGGIKSLGSGILTMIKHLGGIAAFIMLLRNGGLQSILGNIKNMFNTDEGLKKYGSDASTLGMNVGTAILDSQVDSKWDWLNPLKSINHNHRDAAGNSIKNQGMTRARNNVYVLEALSNLNTGRGIKQNILNMASKMYDRSSNRWMNKSLEYANKYQETGIGRYRDLSDKAADLASKHNDDARYYDYESRSRANSSLAGIGNFGANIAVGSGISKLGGFGVEKLVKKFTGNEETAQRWGNATEGAVSSGLTLNYLRSLRTGKTALTQKVINTAKEAAADDTGLIGKAVSSLSSLLKGLPEKISTNKKLSKLVGKGVNIGSKLTKHIDTIINAVKKSATTFKNEIADAIQKKLAKMGINTTVTTVTAGLGIAAGALVGAVSGYCGVEHLFGVRTGDADGTMKTVSVVLEAALRGLEMVPVAQLGVAVFDIFDGFIEGILGCGIKQYIARAIYSHIEGEETLDEKQKGFNDELNYYNSKYGTNLSKSAFNDMTNNGGILSRIWSGKAKVDEETGHYTYDENGKLIKSGGIKNFFTRQNNMYTNRHNKNAEKEVVSDDGTTKVKGNIFTPWKKNSDKDELKSTQESIEKITGTHVSSTDLVRQGGITGYAAAFSTSKISSKILAFIKSATDVVDKDNNEQYELDRYGKPIEYPLDENGKPLSKDGSKYVKKGDYGLFMLSGMRKVSDKLTSPIDQLKKGMDEFNDKESPWKKDGNKGPIAWIKKQAHGLWDSIGKGLSAFNTDVSPDEKELSKNNKSKDIPAGGPDSTKQITSDDGSTTVSQGGNPLNKDFTITSKYGPRTYPHSGKHRGVDLVPADGSKDATVGSRFEGTVIKVKSDVSDDDTAKKVNGSWTYSGKNKGGNIVSIQTPDGKIITNMHLKAGSIPSNIVPGATVHVGDKLGTMGSTGWSTGPHLHYQIEEGEGNDIDPTSSLSGSTISEFKSSSNKTHETRDTSSTSNNMYALSTTPGDSNSSTSTVSSSGSGPLGDLLNALKLAGGKFLSKITGGLIGSTEDGSESSNSSSSSDSKHGGGGASRSASTISSSQSTNNEPEESVNLTSNPDTQWVAVVRQVKELVAAQKPEYNQGGSMEIVLPTNKKLKLRPDCTGLISAMLKVYGALPEGSNVNSSALLTENGIPDKFNRSKWPGWENLLEGDILARNGHAEIFAFNEGNKHYVYNGGSTKALAAPGPTSSSKSSYDVIWRCKEQASTISGLSEHGATSSKEIGNTGTNSLASTEGNNSAIVANADLQTLFNQLKQRGYSDNAAAGIMGAWQEESHNKSQTLEGDYFLHPDIKDVTSSSDKFSEYAENRLFPGLAKSNISIDKNAYKAEDGKYYPGLGLAQWTGPRSKRLLDLAMSKGKSWTDHNVQMDYFDTEISEKGDMFNTLNSKDSPSSAAEYFTRQFEGCNIDSWVSKRKNNAEEIFRKYGSRNSDIATDGDVPAGGDESTINFGSSIGNNNYVKRNNTTRRNISNISKINGSNLINFNNEKNRIVENRTNVDTSEIIQALYQVIKLLEGINGNTTQSNTYLNSLSKLKQVAGNENTGMSSGIPRSMPPQHTQRYSTSTPSGNRMISSMIRPS